MLFHFNAIIVFSPRVLVVFTLAKVISMGTLIRNVYSVVGAGIA